MIGMSDDERSRACVAWFMARHSGNPEEMAETYWTAFRGFWDILGKVYSIEWMEEYHPEWIDVLAGEL